MWVIVKYATSCLLEPSTLSLEEKRLLESLDRLNERLKGLAYFFILSTRARKRANLINLITMSIELAIFALSASELTSQLLIAIRILAAL